MKRIAILLSLILLVLCAMCACDPKAKKEEAQGDDGQDEEVTKMYITIYGNKLEVTPENNSSVKALLELLEQGDITYTADDYGGFEKVGFLGHDLPHSDKKITTSAGDVILYLGNQVCLMVGSNTWSYTRLGRINGYSVSQLRELVGVGKGSAQVTISLN